MEPGPLKRCHPGAQSSLKVPSCHMGLIQAKSIAALSPLDPHHRQALLLPEARALLLQISLLPEPSPVSCVLEALTDAALKTHQKLFVLWPFGLVLCKAKESIKTIRRTWDQGKCYRHQTQTFAGHDAVTARLTTSGFLENPSLHCE